MRAVVQQRSGEAPGATGIRRDGSQQSCAVVDLDRAVGYRCARQDQGVVVGDAVADRAAVGRKSSDHGRAGAPGPIVSVMTADASLVVPAASVAVAVRL